MPSDTASRLTSTAAESSPDDVPAPCELAEAQQPSQQCMRGNTLPAYLQATLRRDAIKRALIDITTYLKAKNCCAGSRNSLQHITKYQE